MNRFFCRVFLLASMLYPAVAMAQDYSRSEVNLSAESNPGSAAPGLLNRYLEQVELVGSGTFEFAFWDIYDVQLFAQSRSFGMEPPFALQITYHRDFSGESIADRSAELIRRQGVSSEVLLARWHSQMEQIFPDVKEGTRILGVHTGQGHARFYADEKFLGEIRDSRFSRYFFNIWLGEDTQAPQLRQQLLGPAQDYAANSR